MFICEECKRVTEPGETRILVVVETRKKTYTNPDDSLTHGVEIVKEKAICPRCAEKLGVSKE